MEAMTAQMQAARVGGASTTSSLAGAGAAQSGGVWISQELWRAIRRQLESKVQVSDALCRASERVGRAGYSQGSSYGRVERHLCSKQSLLRGREVKTCH
jgi:hypothetical protein